MTSIKSAYINNKKGARFDLLPRPKQCEPGPFDFGPFDFPLISFDFITRELHEKQSDADPIDFVFQFQTNLKVGSNQ